MACHLGFVDDVDDIDAAIARLRTHGATVQGEPTHMTEGPTAVSAGLFLSPIGNRARSRLLPGGHSDHAKAA